MVMNMKRSSGVLMHISTLWGDYSVGSFGAQAREWIDYLAGCGFSAWQVLPFCLPDECNSPYKSFSAFSGNPMFIDPETLYEKGLLTKAELESARQKTPYYCEFDRLAKERLPLLMKAAKRFGPSPAIDTFFASHPETESFCRFMALRKANGERPWNEWTVSVPDEETLFLWRFLQYEFFTEWAEIKKYANGKGIRLIGDIPIYVAWDSADVWADPGEFLLDEAYLPREVAGVPPDYFCEDGQLWGNPLYDWEKMKKNGFSWWKKRISFMTECFDGVRIDHFRGFESFFAIPAEEKTAKNGVWRKGPGMALIDALKEAADGALLIAEDLGDITKEVRELVDESGFPGMRVLQFGFLGDENSPHLPHNYDNSCVAYTGTHDNNTLLGYVWELDEETRQTLFAYVGHKGDIHFCYDPILREMFASHAGLLILPVQDLLLYGADTRFNVPGRSEGNWCYRLERSQLDRIDRKKFLCWNRLYGRRH